MELRAAIASDIRTLTGEGLSIDISGFPLSEESIFVKHSLSGMEMCQKIMHDCIQTKSSSPGDDKNKVCCAV